jgi:hypothetical protein
VKRCRSLSLLKRPFQRASLALAFNEQFFAKFIIPFFVLFFVSDVIVLCVPSFKRAGYVGTIFGMYQGTGKEREVFIKLVDSNRCWSFLFCYFVVFFVSALISSVSLVVVIGSDIDAIA